MNQSSRSGASTRANALRKGLFGSSGGRVGLATLLAALAFGAFSASAALAVPPPVATTTAAKTGTETGATMTGTVKQEGTEQATTYWFKYGTTTAYGSTTATAEITANSTPRAVSFPLSSLTPGATYHYRLVASNVWGTNEGADEAFTVGWDAKSPSGEGPFQIEDISCASSTFCVAVGSQAGAVKAKVWDKTKWTASAVVAPEGAKESFLRGISCPWANGNYCMAVGFYKTAGGETKTLAETWNGTGWTLLTPPNPGGATGSSFLRSVSCAGAGTWCHAVGTYMTSGGASKPLAMTWNGTSWTETSIAVESESPGAFLRSISCSNETACTAVGYYQSKAGTWTPLVARWTGGAWAVDSTWTAPESVGNWLEGVSCTFDSTAGEQRCGVAGYYELSGGTRRPVVWTPGAAFKGTQVTPSAPEGATQTELDGISCVNSKYCVAAGRYVVPGRASRSIAFAYEGSESLSLQLPFNATDQAAGDSSLALRAIACPRVALCDAVGSYQNATEAAPLADVLQRKVAPTVITRPVGTVTDTVASLQGSANPNGQSTTAWFEYGKTAAYGTTTEVVGIGEGDSLVALPQIVKNLFTGTTYHYRFVAQNASGKSVGEDRTFTTLKGWNQLTPPNPTSGKPAKFKGVTCVTATKCIAVGEQEATAGTLTAIAEIWDGTSWTVQTIPSTIASLDAVSCFSATDCVAVGYLKSGAETKTAAVRYSGSTTWSALSPPTAGTQAALRDVSCVVNVTAMSGNKSQCVAVGYSITAGVRFPISSRFSQSAGVWESMAVTTPAETTGTELTGISCVALPFEGFPTLLINKCNGVGWSEKGGAKQSSVGYWQEGGWGKLFFSTPPSGAKSSQMTGINCWASGGLLGCTASANYVNSGGTPGAYTQKGGGEAWTTTPVTSPASVELSGVSCISSGSSCIAVGSQTKPGPVQAPFAWRYASGVWNAESPLAPTGAKGSFVEGGVSCESGGSCLGVGYYEDGTGLKRPLAMYYH